MDSSYTLAMTLQDLERFEVKLRKALAEHPAAIVEYFEEYYLPTAVRIS
jgi:hypothetical protein